MKTSHLVIAAAAIALGVAACKKKEPEAAKPAAMPAKAGGKLESKSGSKVTGQVTFTRTPDNKMIATVEVAGATPGLHGVHVHQNGDCSAPDASSAGGHLNPAGVMHGGPASANHHLGDLGNINVAADGRGLLSMTLVGITMNDGPNGILNKSVVVHEKEDDLKTDPSGNSGARVACAVVKPM